MSPCRKSPCCHDGVRTLGLAGQTCFGQRGMFGSSLSLFRVAAACSSNLFIQRSAGRSGRASKVAVEVALRWIVPDCAAVTNISLVPPPLLTLLIFDLACPSGLYQRMFVDYRALSKEYKLLITLAENSRINVYRTD